MNVRLSRLESTIFSPGQWIEKHYRVFLCGLVVLAVVTRAALVIRSPRPFGYVWDLYHEGVVLTYEHGRLPSPNDCWECYNPPLFFICGAPLYALGKLVSDGTAAGGLRVLSLLSMICAGFVIYSCHQTLRLLRPSPGFLLAGTALALVFPCLFISSYSAENDMLLAGLITAFFYRLCLYHRHPARASRREPVLMGILAGFASLTKYPGLLTLMTVGVVLGPRLVIGRRRLRTARDLLIVVSIAGAICGWHYAQNLRMTHKPFLELPGYPDVFTAGVGQISHNWKRYDFHSLRVEEIVDLFRAENIGMLNDFPTYNRVFSTLHALAWTDMSFFTVPSRHGWKLPLHYGEGSGAIQLVAQTSASQASVPPYPAKHVSLWLVDLVLRLGIYPTLLALLGFVVVLRRRALQPFIAFTVISVAVYTWWFLAQPAWALKTKYILFLLPAYIVYTIMGLRSVYHLDRRLGHVAAACLIAALVASEAYLWMFALG